MKRPSIFRQQKFNQEEVQHHEKSQSTLPNINTSNTLNVQNIQHNLSNASTKLCISIQSTKASNRKCSMDFNDSRVFEPSNFKTEPCKFWQSGIQCPYANNCRFAHGSEEKRNNDAKNNTYRTKICKNFYQNGSCNYGFRCIFLHQKTPYQRQKQFYRKRMSQIHKDSELFFLKQKRLNALRQIQLYDDQQNTLTPPSSNSNISSSGSIKKIGQKMHFPCRITARIEKREGTFQFAFEAVN